ncbi:molybdenum cofactor synthesis domain protein [Haliangium ochraceum DSM 14365]|uniref:Molybdopterin molybdenumtransferase n=2 Tax=Haliangium ochraceum TaxID=80816 RepID=D0LYX1_HALO1|nr:molybdenum cofactor synthesis domain protein [Haliangium ochraceum DSM 14365]
MLTVEQASARVRASAAPLGSELVPLAHAQGRILGADLRAGRALPPHDNSAMDGFAVRCADLPGTLPVAGTVAAGDAGDAVLAAGSALRIMTGAPMPAGADAVVIREEVEDLGERARFAAAAQPGDNLRRAGEDIALGAVALAAGMRLGAGELGLAAALGHSALAVARRPRVAILSTGDELVSAEVPPRPGQIVNSNAYALAAQVREAGGIPVDAGIAPDDPDILVARVRSALAADVLLTAGGVSVGDFDFVKDAFARAGVTMDFWKVAVKPGKPLAFGHTSDKRPVFGLPGNPVSSMLGFELFVRPLLLAMQGARSLDRPRATVTLASDYGKRPGRDHYLRARLRREGDVLRAELHPRQGSAMLGSMVDIDALVIAPADSGDLPAGTRLEALLLRAV